MSAYDREQAAKRAAYQASEMERKVSDNLRSRVVQVALPASQIANTITSDLMLRLKPPLQVQQRLYRKINDDLIARLAAAKVHVDLLHEQAFPPAQSPAAPGPLTPGVPTGGGTPLNQQQYWVVLLSDGSCAVSTYYGVGPPQHSTILAGPFAVAQLAAAWVLANPNQCVQKVGLGGIGPPGGGGGGAGGGGGGGCDAAGARWWITGAGRYGRLPTGCYLSATPSYVVHGRWDQVCYGDYSGAPLNLAGGNIYYGPLPCDCPKAAIDALSQSLFGAPSDWNCGPGGIHHPPQEPTCPAGQAPDPVTGHCIPSEPPPEPKCKVQDIDAIPVFICNLPAATAPEPTCPSGQHYDKTTHTCVLDTPTCPSGQRWDEAQKRCVNDQPTCPDGQHLNSDTGECEITPQQPQQPPALPQLPITACLAFDPNEAASIASSFTGAQIPDIGFSDLLSDIPLIGDALNQWWTDTVSYIQDQLAGESSLYAPAFGLVMVRGIFAAVERWVGFDLHEVRHVLSYYINYTMPTALPGWGEWVGYYLASQATDEEVHAYARANGYCDDYTDRSIRSRRTRPPIAALDTLVLRGKMQEGEYADRIREWGVIREDEVGMYRTLRDQSPSPYQVSQYAGQYVFDRTVAQAWRLNDEKPDYLEPWFQRAGLSYDIGQEAGTNGDTEGLYWSDVAWRAHWSQPGLSQVIQIYHRLAPDRDRSREPVWLQGEEFTDNDLSMYLSHSGYSPFWRSKIAALSLPQIGIRQLSILLRQRVIDRQGVYQILRRQGYSAGDADLIAEGYWRQEKQRRQQEVVRASKDEIDKSWEVGAITDEDYLQYMRQIGLDDDEAAMALQLETTRFHVALAEREIKAIKGQFLSGMIDSAEARTLLSASAVSGERVTDYMGEWNLELEGKHRQLEARELIKDTADGIIGLPELVRRLRNLRYRDEDISILVGELSVVVQQRLAKLIEKGLAQENKLKKAQETALRQMKAAEKEAQAALSKHGTPSELVKWLWDGLISEEEVYERMRFIGWPDADIARDIEAGKPKKPKTPQPQGGSSGQQTNTPTRPGSGTAAPG